MALGQDVGDGQRDGDRVLGHDFLRVAVGPKAHLPFDRGNVGLRPDRYARDLQVR